MAQTRFYPHNTTFSQCKVMVNWAGALLLGTAVTCSLPALHSESLSLWQESELEQEPRDKSHPQQNIISFDIFVKLVKV